MNARPRCSKIALAAFGLALLLVTSPAWAQHGGGGHGSVGGHVGSHGGGHFGGSSGHVSGDAHSIAGHSSGHSSGFASDGSFGSDFHGDGHGLSHGFADSFHTDHHFHPFHHHHLFFHHHHYFGGYAYFPFYSYGTGYGSYVYASAPALSGLTLLAFLDNSIVAVDDYWVENDELHYVTSNGTQYTVPLNQIDLDLTAQLNRERGVQFVLRTAPNRP